MYDIALCDDDEAFSSAFRAEILDVMAERGAVCQLSVFSSTDALERELERGARFDLLFLDILFGEEAGIRFANALRERRRDVDIVFVTTCPDYAVAGYSAFPLGYLLKPVPRESLAKVIDRFLEKRAPRALRLATSRGVVRLSIPDVLYFEIYDHDILIHRVGGGTLSWTGTLKVLQGTLPQGCFVRPHRSYLVNLEHVSSIVRYQMRLSSGDVLPISKGLYREVQLSLVEYDDRRSLSL